MILEEAKNIAIDIWNQLKPHCEVIKIAGSIRREKADVKDIEIVALPKTEDIKDMFGETIGKQRISPWFKEVNDLGDVVKGTPAGKYMQIDLAEFFIKLDLFMPDDFDYWRQLVIRTGSADWVKRYIAGGWSNLGWCGTDDGLRLKSECKQITGTTGSKSWKCVTAKDRQTKPPVWKSEIEVFDWLNLKYIEPKYRNI